MSKITIYLLLSEWVLLVYIENFYEFNSEIVRKPPIKYPYKKESL